MADRPISLVIADDNDDARRLALLLFAPLSEFHVLGEAADLAAAPPAGPVQALSGALWTLDALGEALDDPVRRQELLARLRTTLRSALETTRAITRWAHAGDDG